MATAWKWLSMLKNDITLKTWYNDPFNNEISAIKNLILSPSVVNYIVKSPCNNKIPAIKNKIFCPFRLVILRFLCVYAIDSNLKQQIYASLVTAEKQM
jgi:hypothetical protein